METQKAAHTHTLTQKWACKWTISSEQFEILRITMIPFQNDSPTMTQAHTGARETERERVRKSVSYKTTQIK